jgi:hypothetical protein
MTGDWRGWVSSEVSARGGVFPKLGNDADGLHNSTATATRHTGGRSSSTAALISANLLWHE